MRENNSLPNRLLSLFLVCVCLTLLTSRLSVASEHQPRRAPSEDVIAVIDSMVVNGLKSDTATPSDIELLRAGASTPEATVGVGNELRVGDKISTKEDDQLVLRIPNSETGTDDLVFLDPQSEVGIGSVCAIARQSARVGRIQVPALHQLGNTRSRRNRVRSEHHAGR